MNSEENLALMREEEKIFEPGDGEKAIAKLHATSPFSARERSNYLFDEGILEELEKFVEHRCNNFGGRPTVFSLNSLREIRKKVYSLKP